jgi:hypothetical protein
MDVAIATGIISGAAALMGAGLSQLTGVITSSRAQVHAEKIAKQDRFERLATKINESERWANSLNHLRIYDDAIPFSHPEAAREAHALAMLYFPELVSSTGVYLGAAYNLADASVTYAIHNSEDAPSEELMENLVNKFADAADKLKISREFLDSAIEAAAKRRFS